MYSVTHLIKFKMERVYYAAPKIATISLYAPINILQGIYAKYYGLSLTTIASIILFARLFDAITDPIVGILSDKSRKKWGTRKPFMIFGGLILSCSGYFLYSPPERVSVLYFSFWFVVFYLGFTLFEIPHSAWGGELSTGTHEKTKTYNLRTIFGNMGLVMFYGIPLLPFWETTEITPETLRFSAIVSGILMFPLLYMAMVKVPSGSAYDIRTRISSSRNSKPQFSYLLNNKPFLIYLITFISSGIGLGMWYGLIFIYVDSYLGEGQLFSEIFLISLVFGIASSIIWVKISMVIGKKNTWMLSVVISLCCVFYILTLEPGNAHYYHLLILFSLNSICMVCSDTMSQSMLSDIVDYSTLKFGTHNASTYFSIYIFLFKATFAIGGAIGLALAGWYNFDPGASQQSEEGVFGLMLAMVWVPAVFLLVAIYFINLSPITSRRHFIIRRRLDRLEQRSKTKEAKNSSKHIKNLSTV